MGGEGLSPGDEVGSYVVESCLGSGGMGDVYLVLHPHLQKRFALKVLHLARSKDRLFAERFTREMRTVSALDHPSIVAATDAGVTDGRAWYVMSYIDGVDAEKELEGSPDGLPLGRIATILDSIAAALDYAHSKGIVHRDIKPANILLAGDGRVFLTDFGIAKAIGEPLPLTETGILVTPDFASPEQIEKHDLDGRSDGYSLGATLYALLTGRPPFDGDGVLAKIYAHVHTPAPPPSGVKPDLPPALDAVVAKAMAKNPDDRYRTCRDLAAATRYALRSRLDPTRPVPQPPGPPPIPAPLPVPSKPPGRGRWIAAVVAAIVLVAAVGIWIAVRSSSSGTASPTTAESSVTSAPASLANDGASALSAETTGDTAPAAVVPLEDLLDPQPPTRSGTSADARVSGAAAIALGPRNCPNGTQKYSVDLGSGLERITGTFLMSDDADPSTRTQVTVVADAVTVAEQTVAPRAGATIDVDVSGTRDLVIELATAGSGTCGSDDYLIFLTNAQAYR